MGSISKRIIGIFSRRFNEPTSQITRNTCLDDLGASEADVAEILQQVLGDIDVTITNVSFGTVGDVIDFVRLTARAANEEGVNLDVGLA